MERTYRKGSKLKIFSKDEVEQNLMAKELNKPIEEQTVQYTTIGMLKTDTGYEVRILKMNGLSVVDHQIIKCENLTEARERFKIKSYEKGAMQ